MLVANALSGNNSGLIISVRKPRQNHPTLFNGPSSSVLILGIGNYLMGDEGLGVHAAQQLQLELPADLATVVDGGTAGFQLMEYLESYEHVIMIDATLDGKPAGTIQLIQPKFASDFPKAMSTHEIGLKDLVEGLLLLGRMPRIWLFVVSVETIQPLTIELSESVRAALDELKIQVRDLAERLRSKTIAGPLPADHGFKTKSGRAG
jgi:hydrogenase maturation protease